MRAEQSYNHVKCSFQHPYTLQQAFDAPIDSWLCNVVYKYEHPTGKFISMGRRKKIESKEKRNNNINEISIKIATMRLNGLAKQAQTQMRTKTNTMKNRK